VLEYKESCPPVGCSPLGFSSFYGDPDGLASTLGFDDFLLELVEPFAGFQNLADELVAAYEDAAFGVLGGISHVDADALEEVIEVGAAEKHREPHLELRTPSDDYGVTAFWDGEGLQTLSLCR
jgi:hypothetical protein